jgi:macrolide-specific efflux system membrane fusion protein
LPVYFTTLGSGGRRWHSTLRQILPTPTATNNVVTYTGLFDVDNGDGALLSGMTTQVYFVTSSARNVLTVPLGAVTFADAAPTGKGPGDGSWRQQPSGAANGGPSAGGDRASRDDAALGGVTVTNTSFPGDARRRGVGGAGAAAARIPAPRQGRVRVVAADGSIADREVTIGVTSRVTAEVISGLSEGEQVVAGIAQAAAPADGQRNNGNNNFNNNNFNRGFPGGNFPGGFPR